MPWTAVFAVVSLLGVQLAIVAGCLYAYNRIRSQQDSTGHQREAWQAELRLAVSTADTAKRLAETIEVEHFKKLRALYEVQAAELSEARARIVSLEKELKVCQMKLASEERINRRNEKRQAKEDPPEPGEEETAGVPAAPGGDLDSLLRQFGQPLNGAPPAAPAAKPSTFGKTARHLGG
jgi:hypothetical protein